MHSWSLGQVINMRHGLKAKAARIAATALLIAGGALLWLSSSGPADAYSGAQAEAQMDPVWDPYRFPNIELCCKGKKYQKKRGDRGDRGGNDEKRRGGVLKVRCDASSDWISESGSRWGDRDNDEDSGERRRRWRRDNDDDEDSSDRSWRRRDRDDDDDDGDRKSRRRTYRSISAALEDARDGSVLSVFPGAPCDVTGVTVSKAVTIESEDYVYGVRAQLFSRASCTFVSPRGYGTVAFRTVDIDGCIVQNGGRLTLNEVNLSSRSSDTAVQVNGGTFTSIDSTVRARGTALAAVRGVMVSLSGGAFASSGTAEQTVSLETDGAKLQGTMIKGGRVGLRIGLLGRYPVTLNGVQVLRGELNEVYQIGQGDNGIIIGGLRPGDDLPSLPNLPGATVSIEGGVIGGYKDGLVFGPGTRGTAKGVNILHPDRGIVVGAGAAVDLRDNKINNSKYAGIDLAGGAVGSASFNEIECKSGSCVCYAGDCTSRRDKDFAGGIFRMSGTRCRD